mgnify:CR=1 FL=1
MKTDSEKATVELAIFREFAKAANLDVVESSIRKGNADLGEPDVICEVRGRGQYAFELTEACAPEFAAAMTKTRETGDSVFTWGSDATTETVEQKTNKSYRVDCPVDLVVYTNGRTAFDRLNDILVPMIERALEKGAGVFHRVWLLAEGVTLVRRVSSSRTQADG